jgi:hypothetical protein
LIGAAVWRRFGPMVLLLVVCVAFAGIIASEWLGSQDDASPPEPPRPSAAAPSTALNFAMPAVSTYAEVVSRPLFSPTRRPAEPAPAAETVSTSMTLIAILISPRGPHALVRHGTPPQLDRVVEGQTIDGWTTEAIKFDRVIFRRGAETLELVPVSTEQPHPPPPPARPTPPPPARPTPPRPAG